MVVNQEAAKRRWIEEDSNVHSNRDRQFSKEDRSNHGHKHTSSSESERHRDQTDRSRREPQVRTMHLAHKPHDSKQPHKHREPDLASRDVKNHDQRQHQREHDRLPADSLHASMSKHQHSTNASISATHRLPAGAVNKKHQHEATARHKQLNGMSHLCYMPPRHSMKVSATCTHKMSAEWLSH